MTYFSTTPDCLTPSAAVGSSRISTLAPKWTAREIATHWRSPPDSVPMGWSTSRRSMPIASSSSLQVFFMNGMSIRRPLRTSLPRKKFRQTGISGTTARSW